MNPVTHLLIGWLVAESASLNRRERAAVALSAVLPDIDGIGYVVERLTLESGNRLRWYTDYHHEIAHNILFGFLLSVGSFLISRYLGRGAGNSDPPPPRPWLTAFLSLIAFHTHILGDVAGSKGPDGSQWAIPYLLPFSDWGWTWSGQWELNAWPNIAITMAALGVTCYLAMKRGYSPLGIISQQADDKFVQTLRLRFSRSLSPTDPES